jgi:hypothetical protein
MRNKILLLGLLIIFYCSQLSAQNYLAMARPAKIKKWGFINQKGELIIKQEHLICDGFTADGFAAVYDPSQRKFYFINTRGERLDIDIQGFRLKILGMDIPIGFSDGYAAYTVDYNKWGYIDISGKIAVPAKYDFAGEFNEGLAIVKADSKFYILDTLLNARAIDNVSMLTIKHFSEGLAPYKSINEMMGFLDETGKIAIQPQFMSVGYFVNGLAWAKNVDNKIGYINHKGEWVIQPRFDAARDFDPESGLARIRLIESIGYTNMQGEVQYFDIAEGIGDFSNGLCWCRKNKKIGFINATGEWVISPQFEVVRDFKNGFAAVRTNNKWGIIDKKGQWVVLPDYHALKDMELVEN